MRRQSDRLAVLRELHFCKIDRHISEMALLRGRMPSAATDGSAQSCEQFTGTERLGDVVIRANFEEEYFVRNVALGAENNDGNRRRLLLDFPATIVAR